MDEISPIRRKTLYPINQSKTCSRGYILTLRGLNVHVNYIHVYIINLNLAFLTDSSQVICV